MSDDLRTTPIRALSNVGFRQSEHVEALRSKPGVFARVGPALLGKRMPIVAVALDDKTMTFQHEITDNDDRSFAIWVKER